MLRAPREARVPLHALGVVATRQEAVDALERVGAGHDARDEEDELGADAEVDARALPAQLLRLRARLAEVVEDVLARDVPEPWLQPHVQATPCGLLGRLHEALHAVAEHRHRIRMQILGDRGQVPAHAPGVPARAGRGPVGHLVAHAAVGESSRDRGARGAARGQGHRRAGDRGRGAGQELRAGHRLSLVGHARTVGPA